jgi:L-iditol 2-dehydrogenase
MVVGIPWTKTSDEPMITFRKMRCAVWHGSRDMRIEERPVPEVDRGSVLLRVRSCAICGTDLRTYQDGNARIVEPRVLGHEIAGQVAEVGKGVHNLHVGDRISAGAQVPCGICIHCRANHANSCEAKKSIGYELDGGFAQYLRLDQATISRGSIGRLARATSYEEASLAEPLACCLNGYARTPLHSGDSVAIFGAGPIGLMLLMLARHFDAGKVIVIEPTGCRRDLALRLGADVIVDPATDDPVDTVMGITAGVGVAVVFTACPVVDTHEQAVQLVAKRGLVNIFGGLPKTARPMTLLSNQLHYREATLTGSHGSTPEQFRQALDLIESKQIDVSTLVTHRMPLGSINDAFSLARSGKVLKVVILPNDEN